ncbi:branched-chain amino acid ABC transporter substrate-binding protein [Dolosicoccus paucivorans]|uniref:Branched-chain amino acid ABC transporter substrate-binding protein n=1 Tax=Dolosicoccus paucivorans TaxID=84521 RepID=A0A2N6SNT4_9LACT|nr:ABC transporter substrate-binding protein [Dolosicoccus paucivorans]PMB84950.1 branched-chain amino acid ABC transporter substrate-binding protein [Dolosicoccus paucivorans]PMC58721.1 branched-chain amino acid ABC transporter substrate-binding protein [Dolosicoccus paucivorans]
MSYGKFKRMVVAACASMALLGQTAIATAQEAIKIGGNFELSGEVSDYGNKMNRGVQLFIDQVNEKGGVNGRPIEYVVFDNKSDISESASVASRLASEGVVGVVGPALTGNAQAQASVLNKEGIPYILPAATAEGLTLDDKGEVIPYMFRVSYEDTIQAGAAGQFAAEHLNMKKAAIISDPGTDYSAGLAKVFKEQFEKLGGEVVVEQSFSEGDQDFSAVISQLLTQDIDVIYFPGYYTEAGQFIKQAREMGIEQPILGPDGFASPILVELASGHANDIYYTSHFTSEGATGIVADYLKAYQDKYNEESDTFAALAYDAVGLLIAAIEASDAEDKEAIVKALEETKVYEGVTGTFSMDEEHNPVKPALLLELQDGQVVYTTSIEVKK